MKLTAPIGFLALILVIWMAQGCQRKEALDARAMLLAAARNADANFPDGKTSKLTKFALVGRVVTSEQVLQVVEMRLVLTGMPAPRGQQYLVFFDASGNWIGSQPCNSTPLWCEGSKVFLFGLDEVAGVEGNAWDLQNGFKGRTLIRQPEYGSYLPPDRSDQ